jgi:hypothetical protein
MLQDERRKALLCGIPLKTSNGHAAKMANTVVFSSVTTHCEMNRAISFAGMRQEPTSKTANKAEERKMWNENLALREEIDRFFDRTIRIV